VPGQQGRVAVVTGANTGLGFETAKVLADRGATVVLAVRDVEKGKQAAARFGAGADVTVQELDLASLESVRAAAADLHATLPKIDLLINNAGVMYPPRQTTRDGFELQFGTNHLGPHGTNASIAAHPGVARTELMRNSPAVARALAPVVAPLISHSAERGALPILRAATDPGALGGQYYGPDGPGGYRGHPEVVASTPQSYDVAPQQRLWTVSEELTGVKFPVD